MYVNSVVPIRKKTVDSNRRLFGHAADDRHEETIARTSGSNPGQGTEETKSPKKEEEEGPERATKVSQFLLPLFTFTTRQFTD